jgi:hypothetical protein
MPFDPAWDMPQVNWQQQGSFEAGELALAYPPDAAPLVCIPPINQYWLPYIQGCLDQLVNPSTWITSSDTALNDALDAALKLKQIVGQAGACFMYQLQFTSDCRLQYSTDGGGTWTDVAGWDANFANCVSSVIIPPVPPNPGHDVIQQHACNISGYLSSQIIQLTVTHAVNGYNTGLTQLQFAQDILDTIAYAFPITSIALTIFHDLYAAVTGATISDFTAASTDPALWGAVTCAIYSAIRSTGYITAANLPNVIANVCAISYVHADVVTALCSFITNVGLQNLQAMQNVGVVDTVDCSGCAAPWCYEWIGAGIATPSWKNASYDGGGPFTRGTVVGSTLQSVYASPPGVQILDFGQTFPSTFISTILVEGNCPEPAAGGQRSIEMFGINVNLPTTAGAFSVLGHFNITNTYFDISVDTVTANSTMFNTVTHVKVTGTGVCPFGTPNC